MPAATRQSRLRGHRLQIAASVSTNVELVRTTTRLAITLARPLGLVLGDGCIVEEVTPGGNAARGGKVQPGDVLTGVEFPRGMLGMSSTSYQLEDMDFEEALDLLASDPSVKKLKLTLERSEFEEVATSSSDDSGDLADYWTDRRTKAKGRAELRRSGGLEPQDIQVHAGRGVLGGGSFGTVFAGTWRGRRVVLKRANERVVGAEELLETELAINETAAKSAPGTCAEYIGCCEVGAKEGGQAYQGRLSSGLWLVFAYEGGRSLADLAKAGRGGLKAVAQQLALPASASEAEVVRTAMRQLLESLVKLHFAGIVHRDVKPQNIVTSEAEQRLKLIDLGGAAVCGKGGPVSYSAGAGAGDPAFSSVMDPTLLPPGAPEPTARNLGKLWREHTPDRHDVFSAGITMLWLAVPALRKNGATQRFVDELAEYDNDLAAWAGERCEWREHERAVLDADDQAGWLAAAAMLAPRPQRVSAAEALRHPFFV